MSKVTLTRTETVPVKKIRIYNPVTNTYYQIRQKTTCAGRKGSIIGKWSSKKSN